MASKDLGEMRPCRERRGCDLKCTAVYACNLPAQNIPTKEQLILFPRLSSINLLLLRLGPPCIGTPRWGKWRKHSSQCSHITWNPGPRFASPLPPGAWFPAHGFPPCPWRTDRNFGKRPFLFWRTTILAPVVSRMTSAQVPPSVLCQMLLRRGLRHG